MTSLNELLLMVVILFLVLMFVSLMLLLNILEFLLTEFEHDIKYAEFEYLDIPKNTISTIDFIISAIGKVQKGQRLALGLDDDVSVNEEPVINIIEGLSEEKV